MPSKEALISAVKEFFRVIVIAVIPVIISNFSDNTFNWKVIAITGAIAGLKFIDKLLHEMGKEIEETGTIKDPVTSELTKGITRF
jgi:hypothetical protein